MLPLYRIALLHAKANRIIKRWSFTYISQFKLTSVEWVILGYLADNLEGKRIRDIAQEISVEAPFITSLLNKLQKSKFIKSEVEKKDKRAKTVKITKAGLNALDEIKKQLNDKEINIFSALSQPELRTYMNVLEILTKKEIDTL